MVYALCVLLPAERSCTLLSRLPPPPPLFSAVSFVHDAVNNLMFSFAQGTRKNVRMHGPVWDKISTEAKELIKNLMAFDAGARLTVDKV